MILIFWWAEDSNKKTTPKNQRFGPTVHKNGMAESSGPRGYPGQRLQDEKKVLEGQVFHKRSCGNKLLFPPARSMSHFGVHHFECKLPRGHFFLWCLWFRSFEMFVKTSPWAMWFSGIGTWRDCGTIFDVFSYSIQSRWVDVSGGASFQAPEAKIKQHQPGRSNVVQRWRCNGCKGWSRSTPAPFDSTSHRQRRNLCKFWMSNGTCIMTLKFLLPRNWF